MANIEITLASSPEVNIYISNTTNLMLYSIMHYISTSGNDSKFEKSKANFIFLFFFYYYFFLENHYAGTVRLGWFVRLGESVISLVFLVVILM